MATSLRSRPRPDSRLRCAVCHDGLEAAAACPSCDTRFHEECRALLAGPCPTRGCRGCIPRAEPGISPWLPLAGLGVWVLAGAAVSTLPGEAASLARGFDRVVLLALWAMAGPLLAATACDRLATRRGR